jgi:hypothetical protein
MVIFVLLTYLISWSFVIPTDGGLISYGPMIAAFIGISSRTELARLPWD